MDIKVTETAKSRLYDMGISDEIFLRIGVRSGGCSGNTYDAVLDDNMSDVDEVYYSEDKLRIVGELIGRSKKVHADDIYECMLDLHDMGKKITIGRIAGLLDCSTRTIHRSMPEELKREKELLNQQL